MGKVEFDYSALKGAIRAKGYTYESLAKKARISKATLTNHFSNGTGFRAEQAISIGHVLELDTLEPYFLTLKTHNL